MQLVLAGKITWPGNGFEKKLSSYKFREAVILQTALNNESLALLTSAAYASINPSDKLGFVMAQLEAMCCGVPVIAVSKDSDPANGAVLYAGKDDPGEIANQMKLLYKDEHLRDELILQGHAESEKYKADTIAALFWTSMVQTVTIH